VKKRVLYLLVLVFCLNNAANLHGQIVSKQTQIDSMLTVLNNSKDDTLKVHTMNSLVLQLVYTGGYRMADSMVNEELKLANALEYKRGIAHAYNSMGVVANYQSDYSHSLEYLLKSLEMFEALRDTDGLGISYKYIGAVYAHQGDTSAAFDYFRKAVITLNALRDTNYVASTLISMGNLYETENMHTHALENLRKSFRFFSKINNKDGEASALMYIGGVFKNEKSYDSARTYVLCGKQIFEELKDDDGISRSLDLLGVISMADNKYAEALAYENNSLSLAKKIGSLECTMIAEKTMSDIYEKKGDGVNALMHYRAYMASRDSIFSQQNTLKTLSAEMSYADEKKEAAKKAADDKKEALHAEEIKRNKAVITGVLGVLKVLTLFVIFMYRTNRQRKKANIIIERKNFQITQSIDYAERIQRAMLPDISEIHGLLPESFVLFKPKDIVSGDFYFLQKKDDKIVLAVADCTGHGVPGGFMSMLCSEKLSDSIYQTQNTGEIMEHLNKGVKSSLHQSGSEDSMYDGMDIALCVIHPVVNGMKLNFAGALRPLWIIRSGTNEVEEISPTPRTIGGFTPNDQEYATYIIQLHKGDVFYMFTDGYVDQFGGETGRKYGLKRFKEFLISIHNFPMESQQKELATCIETWRGNNLQLDDMLVVGVKV